ncbi:MAG: hypothetical protein HQ478_04165 [Chloroflexi bacterium]|nr:hypothetical protein [Chloroflexota bacterium]
MLLATRNRSVDENESATVMRRSLKVVLVLASTLVATAAIACGGVDRDPADRSTPFVRPPDPTATPPVTPFPSVRSIEVDSYLLTPVDARFVQDQPGLAAVALTLDISVHPRIPVANIKWGPRLEFTEINIEPFRTSATGEPKKLVVRLSWGRSNFVDLRPDPEVSRLDYKIVGGTTRSFVIGFNARIPSSVMSNLTLTVLEGTVDEHQDGVALEIASIPLVVPAPHPASRLSEVEANAFLVVDEPIAAGCRGNEVFLSGTLRNNASHELDIGLIELMVFDISGLPLDELAVNRSGRQIAGNFLDRAADDPYRPGETSEFGFIIPADASVCANGNGWALIHEDSLIATGQLQGS